MPPIRILLKNLLLVLVLLAVPALQAQPKQPVPTAPLPSQITEVKSVFIAYAGSDSDVAGYSGDSGRAYNTFFAAMKSWGQYQLVPAPAGADLVIEIRFVHPLSTILQTDDKTILSVKPYDDPQIVLSLRDPKSNVLLWTLIRHIPCAILQRNRDKNFDQAMDYLLDDMKRLAEPPASAAQNAPK